MTPNHLSGTFARCAQRLSLEGTNWLFIWINSSTSHPPILHHSENDWIISLPMVDIQYTSSDFVLNEIPSVFLSFFLRQTTRRKESTMKINRMSCILTSNRNRPHQSIICTTIIYIISNSSSNSPITINRGTFHPCRIYRSNNSCRGPVNYVDEL